MNDLTQDSLSAKEVLILGKVPSEGAKSQRELSKKSGFSVGIVNILIRNLIQKGYIKLSKINRKNIRYLLTPKGVSEQYQLTCLYIQDTFNKMGNYKKWIGELVEKKTKENCFQFIIIGKNELANIVEVILKNYNKISYVKIAETKDISASNMIILDCQDNSSHNEQNSNCYINIIEYISKKMN